MKKYLSFLILASSMMTGCDPDKTETTPGTISVTGVAIVETDPTVEVGKTLQLTANVLPEEATNQNKTWSSGDEAKATVDPSTGVVTGVAAGDVTITVETEDGKKQDTVTVSVTQPEPDDILVESVAIVETDQTLEVGDVVTLSANVLPAEATNKNFTWSSSDPTTVAIDAATGEVEALAATQEPVVITVTTEQGEKQDTVTVTVTEPVVDYVSIEGVGFDIEAPITIYQSQAEAFKFQIDFEASRGIDLLFIEMKTEDAGLQQGLILAGFDKTVDLANPSDEFLRAQAGAAIMGIVIPYGDQVKGKKELRFDASSMVSLGFMLLSADSADLTIKTTLSDDQGRTVTKTATITLKKDPATRQGQVK